jgi:hypothetical protein
VLFYTNVCQRVYGVKFAVAPSTLPQQRRKRVSVEHALHMISTSSVWRTVRCGQRLCVHIYVYNECHSCDGTNFKIPHQALAHPHLTELLLLLPGFVRNKMVPILLLASLIWSVTQSHDQHHHVMQDTTPAVGNVSIMTYSGGRKKGLSAHVHCFTDCYRFEVLFVTDG